MRLQWMGSFLLVACGGAQTRPAPTPAAAPTSFTVIDLSATLDETRGMKMEPLATEKPVFVAMANVTLFNHSGSHYDPPAHVIKDGATAEAVDLDKLVGPARVLDFRSKPKGSPLGRADFEGKVEAGDFVIAFVGCAPGETCAYVGKDAAEYLASIPVRAFGTDMWTISNPGNMAAFSDAMKAGQDGKVDDWIPEHYAFLSHDVPVIEGLTNLEAVLSQPDATIVALPLKLQGANGSPARVVALVPRITR